MHPSSKQYSSGRRASCALTPSWVRPKRAATRRRSLMTDFGTEGEPASREQARYPDAPTSDVVRRPRLTTVFHQSLGVANIDNVARVPHLALRRVASPARVGMHSERQASSTAAILLLCQRRH